MKKKDRKIISTHVPKTAGTSFRNMLYDAYGEENILSDYDDDPVNPLSRYSIDPGYYHRNKIVTLGKYKAVHGHFAPSKYQYINNAVRIMFLRHPIDNIISIYYYWKNLSITDSPILNYVRDCNLSIIEFASLPRMRWLYTKTYFGDCDMSTFDFIGDYSRYDDDLDQLSELLGIQLNNSIFINRTGEDDASILKIKENTLKNNLIKEKLSLLLSNDVEFYKSFTLNKKKSNYILKKL
jgi:hypothetical protein